MVIRPHTDKRKLNSFEKQNYHNVTENNLYQNAHPLSMDNPLRNQIMEVRIPPGPSYGGGTPHIAPPLFIPQLHDGMYKAIDAGSMNGRFYQHTYVWFKNVRSFCFPPNLSVKIRGRLSMVTGATEVAYYGTDGHKIQSFQCYLKKQSAFADCSVDKGGVRNGLTPNHDYKRRLGMKPRLD